MPIAKFTDLDLTIAANIRRYRKERKLTQEKLAEAAGISTSHCSNIERACKSVSLESLRHLSVALGVTVDALMSDEWEHPSDISARNIANIVKDMTPEDAKKVEKMIHFMLDEGMLT